MALHASPTLLSLQFNQPSYNMKPILYISLTLLMVLLVSACGGEKEPITLAEKRAKLEELKGEQAELNKEIVMLTQSVESMDTTIKIDTRTPVKTATLAPSTIDHYLEIQGSVASDRNVMVSPKASGPYLNIFVQEGQYVAAGTKLAKIDDAVMKASKSELETSIDLSKIIFEKQDRLWKQEIGTEIQYLQAKNNYEALQKRLATLEEQIDMTVVRAPISGNVDQIMPKIGEMATPGMPSFRIISATALSLKADVAENYAPFIKRGKSVKVYFPAIDKEMMAKISSVGQSINPTSRTFEIEAKLPANKDVKVNMYGKMAINDRTLENVIAVPLELLQKGANGNYVYIAEPGKDGKYLARRKEVKTGLSYEGSVEITSGLKAGDQVITVGFKDLSDGQKIAF